MQEEEKKTEEAKRKKEKQRRKQRLHLHLLVSRPGTLVACCREKRNEAHIQQRAVLLVVGRSAALTR